MSLREIVVVPHDALSRRAEEITDIDDAIVSLATDMAETMYRAPGIGLAANQVGELRRVVVLDVEYAYAEAHEKRKKPIILLNPVISHAEGVCLREEGCLSVPEFGVEVERPEFITAEGVDLDGKPVKIETGGLLARALQHEIEHLEGRTLLDHASPLKRNLYRRKMKKKARKDA